jgi:hypothetical protein
MAGDAFDVSCCTGAGAPPGTTVGQYFRLRNRSDYSFSTFWVEADRIPSGAAGDPDFGLYNPVDGLCYWVHYGDGTSPTPTGVVLDGWEAFDVTGEESELCSGSTPATYLQARTCPTSVTTFQGHVTDAALVALNGGSSIPAGTYDIAYVDGAINFFGGGANWTLSSYQLVRADGSIVTPCPSLTSNYASAAAAATAAAALPFTRFTWGGGVLYVKLFDSAYADNIVGAPGTPQFRLQTAPADVDLWVAAGAVTIPYFFSLSGVNYSVPADANTDTTPGTMLSGETVESGCPSL